MKTPLISIIMNCYNSDRFLKEAIDSVVAQTYQNWEIIFWDNASTDNSAYIAKKYDQRLRYFFSKVTTPLGEARNLALTKAAGKYIAFLDCDDVYLPDKLEKQVQLMKKSDYALCYGSSIMINEHGTEIKRTRVKNQSGKIFGQLLIHYEINMQSVMLRSSILDEAKLSFENNLKYCPDHNLFMEIASRYVVGVLPEFIVKYRVLDNSLSKRTVDIASAEIKFTLDKISSHNPKIKKKFTKEFIQAYNKLNYYNAVAFIYRNDRKGARKEIASIASSKVEYCIFYFLLFLPVSNETILKILGR